MKIFSISILYFTIASFTGCASGPIGSTPEPPKKFEIAQVTILSNGSCFDSIGKAVFLENLRWLDGNKLSLSTGINYGHVEISGVTLNVYPLAGLANSGDTPYSVNIRQYLIQRQGYPEPFDVKLRFAQLNGQSVLYWKETFENISYRQGLIKFGNGEVGSICVGRGGSYRAH